MTAPSVAVPRPLNPHEIPWCILPLAPRVAFAAQPPDARVPEARLRPWGQASRKRAWLHPSVTVKRAARPADQREPSAFDFIRQGRAFGASSSALRLRDGKTCGRPCASVRAPFALRLERAAFFGRHGCSPPDTWTPNRCGRPTGCRATAPSFRASAAFRPASSPFGYVSGNRETQRFCFPEPCGPSGSRTLCA